MGLYQEPNVYGYVNNKDIKFKRIDSIYIKKFRSIKDRPVKLGSNITLISGKNGTLKSSILGLIAHPFSSSNEAVDMFGKPLKTQMKQVFRLSFEKDIERYQYEIRAITDKDEEISEIVKMYPRVKEKRHRITVGLKHKAGEGNFSLNTAYINLKRLFPIVDTKAEVFQDIELSESEKQWISRAYLDIMTRDTFTEFDCVSDFKDKNTLGPRNASYDFNSISSGEDNLGNILMKMLAFERFKTEDNCLQGIFCIDEIEASLHPVALTNLFDFMLRWSERNRVQIVATTHSLYLIDHALKYQNRHEKNSEKVCINIISTAMVGTDCNYRIINNPSYKDAYKELTLKSLDEDLFKVNILCEDDIAASFIKLILGNGNLKKNIEIISDVAGGGQTGSSCSGLISLGKNGAKLLEDSMIILDPDVKQTDILPVLNKGVSVFILPDIYNNGADKGWPIEKSICKYIFELPGDDAVFSSNEKLYYTNSLHNYEIRENDIDSDSSVKSYKNWQKNNKKDYNKFLRHYVKNNEVFGEFRQKILECVNDKRSKKGLPLVL